MGSIGGLLVDYEKLIKEAMLAKEKAYAPYSKFRVGAALLSENGEVYTGCNVENISYGLSNCAERTAVFKAISEGIKEFKAIAIVADTEKIIAPCGACRQVLLEFNPEMEVIMANKMGEYKVNKVKNLMPLAFDSLQIEEENRT